MWPGSPRPPWAISRGRPADRQQRSCSRRAFDAEGGFAAVMGHAAQRVEVWAVIAGSGRGTGDRPGRDRGAGDRDTRALRCPARSRPAQRAAQPGAPTAPTGASGYRATLPCVLPDLIVVECRHPSIPLAPHGGETVAKIAGRPMDPSTPLRVVVELGADGPSWIACFIDPAKPAAARGRVTLVGPPVGRLRVR